jgi:hypothetical protein
MTCLLNKSLSHKLPVAHGLFIWLHQLKTHELHFFSFRLPKWSNGPGPHASTVSNNRDLNTRLICPLDSITSKKFNIYF